MRVKCLGQEHNTMSPARARIYGPFDPETSTLTMSGHRANFQSRTVKSQLVCCDAYPTTGLINCETLNMQLFFSCNIHVSNTRDSVSSGYPNTEKRVENTTRSGVFLTKFEVFG